MKKIAKLCKLCVRKIYAGINFFLYIIYDKKKDKSAFEKMGYKNIRPFVEDKWRFGNNDEFFVRRYYLGEKDETVYFLKMASFVDGTLANEIKIYDYLAQQGTNLGFKLGEYSNNFRNKYNFLAIEYIEELKELKDYNNAEDLLLKLNNLLDLLFSLKMIHADISRGNIMLNSKNEVVLFDFGISSINQEPAEVRYGVHFGTYYRTTGKVNTYDDAYSLLCILDVIGIDHNLAGYVEIKEKLGRYELIVNL